MTEAISVILAMAMFAAMVAAIVGVVIGFRRKRWRLAIITGSIFGALFVVVTIFMGATGQLDDLETETPTKPVEQPVAAPAPEPASVQPVLIPEPTPMVGGLGVSRDEAQRRFEEKFRDQGIIFQSTESTDGTPTVLGSVDSKRMAVILVGTEDELLQASMLFTIGGASEQDVRMQFAAMNLLADVAAPEWEERREWILESSSFLADFGRANFETTHGDKHIQFAYSPSTTQALLTIELPSSDMPNPTSSIPNPTPMVGGLGISRAGGQQSFESIGYEFESAVSRFDGQPQTVAYGPDKSVMIIMTGSDDDLVAGSVSGSVADAPVETTNAMGLLAQTLMPSEYDKVVQWLIDTMTKITDDPARYMEKELVQTYGGKQLTFSTMSTALTGHVSFKIDSSSDPAQVAETQTITELEFDCAMVKRVYWLVRNVGDHQMAVGSVWDEMVRTTPNADFGMETAARAVEECGIESP